MKRPAQTDIAEKSITLVYRLVIGLVLGAVLVPQTMAAGADDRYQQNALFNPSQSQLSAETRGRVMIYDGLDDDVVERALDNQFGRIEHMMFIRIRKTRPDGEVLVENDDC